MADTAQRRMTLDEYLIWESRQEGKHEFVDGVARAMVGAQRNHNRIATRVLVFLANKLAGSSCEPFGSDMKVVSPSGNARYPDVTVDCDPGEPDDLIARRPTVIFEVYSKRTTVVDQTEKLEEYQSIESVRHIVHLHQNVMRGAIWTRDGEVWKRTALVGPQAVADLAAIGVHMSLQDIYEGVPLGDDVANDE